MQSESFIAGKDASLESSIRTMQAKLAALGFHAGERSRHGTLHADTVAIGASA